MSAGRGMTILDMNLRILATIYGQLASVNPSARVMFDRSANS